MEEGIMGNDLKHDMEEVEETAVVAIQETQMAKPELIDTETIIANIKAEKEIRVALTEHLMEALVPKIDYYTVKKGGKNSLGKSGAEKVCFMFNLVPKYVILEKTVNKERAEYEIRCDMYNKITEQFAGSGVGSSSSKEDKVVASMSKQGIHNVESVANNMLKIAKKRAYVDATLSSTMISFMFTQDLEDGYVGYGADKTPGGQTGGQSSGQKEYTKGKFPTNREFWDSYDKTKVNANVIPQKMQGKTNSLIIKKIQPESKKPMTAQEFIRGYQKYINTILS